MMELVDQVYPIYCSYAVCASEFNAISDERIKTNINNLELGLSVLTKIKPVTYNHKIKIEWV